jgi:phage terminase small subunit
VNKGQRATTPPAHLSKRSQLLWEQLQPEHARSIGRQLLLEQALEAFDRCNELKKAIAEEGLCSTTASTGARHVNPLVGLEREARRTFLKLFTQLGCDWSFEVDAPL